jgi:predicted NAD/FAD-binding protein
VPFEFTSPSRIAVIGAGVSGLGAAYQLAGINPVTLFEAAPRLGGHARTVVAGRNGDVSVDTGFIVFNYPNYPHLTKMFAELDVPVKKSDMSFAASIGDGFIEYGLRDLGALTAQTRNMVRPQFWRMIADILKFNKHAVATATDPDLTLGELLDRMELGEWFRRYYLLPISGAIWSSTPEQIESFPARALVQFFENHALLTPKTHQWHTVDGGSIEYVTRIAAAIRRAGGEIRTGAPVAAVRRRIGGVSIRANGGDWEDFDQVIFACHSDDALAMLEAPTGAEQEILGAVKYQGNRAILHRDPGQMPKRKSCWASWVYLSPDDRPAAKIGITYWMNSLQGIDRRDPLFVTLNPGKPIRDEMIYDEAEFRHPVFDRAALRAQEALPGIQGDNNTWFCGAWARHGFHEDGYTSAVAVAERIREREIAG